MRAVWSFWSRPHALHYHRHWHSERAHLLCWALSVTTALAHVTQACLVTDSAGAALLVDRLRLPFTSVDTALDRLDREGADPHWWVLGKLAAYAAQPEPFLHLDADVFLWKPPPPRLMRARVVTQNPERFDLAEQSLYRADAFLRAVEQGGGWLPDAWRRYAQDRRTGAQCCGIVGGTDLGFLHRYARAATATIRRRRNAAIWDRIGVRDNILVEQYFLSACLAAEAGRPGGVRPDEVAHLFASSDEAFDPAASAAAGYTHLIGDAKADKDIAARVTARVQAADLGLFERCERAAAWIGGS